MSLTIKNCLNRWCLRTMQQDGAVGLIRLIYADRVGDVSERELSGRPPAELACIAPYCHHWEAIDAEHGICLIRSLVKSAPMVPAC